MKRKKIGVMGGTFDPIHNGHLAIAGLVKEKLALDEVVFIPDNIPPHKLAQHWSPAQDRYKMTELGIQGKAGFVISDLELKRAGISYTYDTLKYLRDSYGDEDDFYFIVGADSLVQLHTWHKAKELIKLCTFVAVTRPGFASDMADTLEDFKKQGIENVVMVETPEFPVSSTQIRNLVRAGKPIAELVPKAVAEYIRQTDLYRR
jgi:nicotinate-nucleotide adenylyltransferase